MKLLKGISRFFKNGVSATAKRFPLTVLCLAVIAGVLFYVIQDSMGMTDFLAKVICGFTVFALLGAVAQLICERKTQSNLRPAVYGASFLIAALFFFLVLFPSPDFSMKAALYTFVASFALTCCLLIAPSIKGGADFNKTALVHFKSFWLSVFYAGVLSLGLSAILLTVDFLLFSVDSDIYSYMLVIVWVLFAPIFYLSLLPSPKSPDISEKRESYPKFLEILVSYIAIPIIAAYTLVILAYFVKILFTLKWPVGQLGVMVLIYSAGGFIIYILASLLENHFARLYRVLFPKVLIPIVAMQLVSVGIRVRAYGVTESRYYVILFGIFTLCAGIFLSIKPVLKNGVVAVLAAGFAVFSLIPPTDAFTVSRVSQTLRLETMLRKEGMLIDGVLTPKPDASINTKYETTNILSYLNRSGNLGQIKWLPRDYHVYSDMEVVFGFPQQYSAENSLNENRYLFHSLDGTASIPVSGYDIYMMIHYYEGEPKTPRYFQGDGVTYLLSMENTQTGDVRFIVENERRETLLEGSGGDFFSALDNAPEKHREADPQQMTLTFSQNGYRLKLVFEHISGIFLENGIKELSFNAHAFLSVPPSP